MEHPREVAVNMTRGMEAAVLRLLVAKEIVTANEVAAAETEVAERLAKDPKLASTALDLLLERGKVTRRDVTEMSCFERIRLDARAKKISTILYAVGGVIALGIALFSVARTLGNPSLDPKKLIVKRPRTDAIHAEDASAAGYARRKAEEVAEGAKRKKTREDEYARLHAEDDLKKIQEAREKVAAAKRAREAEAAARAEEERLKAEAEAALQGKDAKELAEATGLFDRYQSEIEPYVRIFRYRKAIDEYKKYRATLRFPSLQQRIDRRVAEIDKLAMLMDRLQEAVNRKTLRDDKVQYGETAKESGTITAATEDDLEVTIRQGFIRTRWDFMRPAQIADLFRRLPLSAEEEFLLGAFSYESGLIVDSWPLFLSAEKRDKGLKDEVDKFLSSKRGFASVPAGGFVHYQGRLVTVQEKDYFDHGFIFYGGVWIKPDERVYVDKGWVKQDSKWIPREEAELLAKGFRKYKDKWYSAEELAAIHSVWADAWESETEHYKIRTNTTEAFCLELGRVMEQAFAAYSEHYGRKYSGPKMNIYGFRAFEDYRAFCIEMKLESHIPAAGHASGDKNYGCGYAKYGGNPELIATLVHEGSHLFYDRAVQGWVPSWYHEGQATYFEGFTWDGTTLTFNHISKMRLPWLVQAMNAGKTIPIKDLLQGDALASINKGAADSTLFYSEAWGLYYFLVHTDNADLKAKFAGLREKYASRALGPGVMMPAGAYSSFVGEMGSDLDALEAAWKTFILGLRG